MTQTKNLLRTVILASASAVLAVACAAPQPSYGPTVTRNKVKVAESVERLELYARPNGIELSARDKFAVGQFIEAYRQSGNGPLFVNTPLSAGNGIGISQAQTMIRTLAAQSGINPSAIQMGKYQTDPRAQAPLVVSYRTLKAVPRDCRYLDDLTLNYNNQPSQSFGCSATANLAAMVSDPRQFLEPYALGTSDTQRRIVVYDKYIQGEPTASERPPEQSQTLDNN